MSNVVSLTEWKDGREKEFNYWVEAVAYAHELRTVYGLAYVARVEDGKNMVKRCEYKGRLK